MNGTLALSLLGGGLSGACVNAWMNIRTRRRDLRTRFYPLLNDIHSAYVIRMEKPRDRYWVTVIGNVPTAEDTEFVEHRANFIQALIEFNELYEARVLRKAILDNQMAAVDTPGLMSKLDLLPEAEALDKCLTLLHDKLRLDSVLPSHRITDYIFRYGRIVWSRANFLGLCLSAIGGLCLASALSIGHSRFSLVATNEADTVNKTRKIAICVDGKAVVAGFGGPLVQTDEPCPAGIGPSVAAVIEAERPSLAFWGVVLTLVGFACQIPSAWAPAFGTKSRPKSH